MNIYHEDDIPEYLKKYFEPAPQLGLEKTPEEYVANMVKVFSEVKRVLKKEGVLFLNLGDSYAGSGGTGSQFGQIESGLDVVRPPKPKGNIKAKDLVGIPWMTAFALRQPYEHHLINIDTDRSWLAAMVDGEGCITIPECKSGHGSGSSYPPIIQIRMCDKEALEKCIELTGKGGNLTEQLPPSYAAENQRPAYQWRINGDTVADVLSDIYPYLLIKRKQACVAWTLQKIRNGYETKKGCPIPDEALQKQLLCRDIIGKLNQRESVDLPKWVEEPTLKIEQGWYLRQDLIWHKPNPMPESVTDRCTKAHEYIFLMAKSQKYYYDNDAIKEPLADATPARMLRGVSDSHKNINGAPGQTPHSMNRPRTRKTGEGQDTEIGTKGCCGSKETRNKRSVWTITTKPFKGAHFATFPMDLIEPMVKAGCPKGGLILDPFSGAGTTACVAKSLGRNYLGIELNSEYVKMSEERIANTSGILF